LNPSLLKDEYFVFVGVLFPLGYLVFFENYRSSWRLLLSGNALDVRKELLGGYLGGRITK
jgi:hypothetical protein